MKILTWNVQGRNPTEQTWAYIDSLRPDIVFVQEAVAPTGPGFDSDRWLWKQIGDNSRFGSSKPYWWATGIRVSLGRLNPLDTSTLGPGWVVGATYEAEGRTLTLINAHIEIVETATATLLHTVTELEQVLRSDDVVFGGDLNVDRVYGEVHGTLRHAEALDRVGELGLFHVNELLPSGTRTFVTHPYQDDHFFVSESLRDAIEDVTVLVGSRAATLSDHYPLLLELLL